MEKTPTQDEEPTPPEAPARQTASREVIQDATALLIAIGQDLATGGGEVTLLDAARALSPEQLLAVALQPKSR